MAAYRDGGLFSDEHTAALQACLAYLRDAGPSAAAAGDA
jgi:hypothetical protein